NTIQLLFECENKTQDVILGEDAGSENVGLCAVGNGKELYSAEVKIRGQEIVKLLSTRRQMRRVRRSQAHKRLIAEVHKILPISKVIIEVASFDIQKIKNPIIKGKEYRQGEMYGWENIRQYILFRDKYQCQAKKTCKNKNFEVNHIETRMTGGNAPNNLNLLCKEHHQDYTDGKLKKKFVRGESYKHQTFMNTMRWKLFKELKAIYPNISLTYGYITSIVRKANKLPKSHRNDALCIGGNPKVERLDNYLQIKQVRKKKRNLAEATFQKEHIRRKLNAKQIVRKEGL
ncbi:10641_t:CDS:2, partial [Funneliformis geosporum]